ncbi:MAG: hypothetical protein K2N83_02215, partial [Eubacterium sp.]|nr:hypothetical protein [Eubacterium sp.]
DESYIVENYNIVLAEKLDNYNAGYKTQETGSIAGNVFDDMNYDGSIDEMDSMLAEIEIGLKRYVYENGEWISAQPEEEEYFATTVTDENGGYIFNNLETYISDEEGNRLYGYELYVIGMQDRFVTKYQMNNGDNDSALIDETYQIIKKDTSLSEMFKGCIVLAQSAKGQENPNTPYIIENYDVVQAVHLTQYNAGFVPVREYSISGYVWNDTDRDGVLNDDTLMSGIEVTLERYYLLNGKWYELAEEEITDESNVMIALSDEFDESEETPDSNVSVTDENGYYSFNNLPLYTEVDGQTVVCGYKVKIEEIPVNYAVTAFREGAEAEDYDDENEIFSNNLNDKTGYLENEDALIVLADAADETTPLSYNIEGFNISYGNSVEHMDAGLVPYGTGSIAGVVFEDANENGIYDEGELIFEGEAVYLEYYLVNEDGEGEFTSYQNMKALSDENGEFVFENLPIIDENNEPYQYHLRMQKPTERNFTKAFDFVVLGEQKANILYEYADDVNEESNIGITPVISLAVERKDNNFYNLKYQLDGYNHTNAYLAFSGVEESESVYTGLDSDYKWIIAVPITVLAFGLILIIGKKR